MNPIIPTGEWLVTMHNKQRYFCYVSGKKLQIARARLVMMNMLHTSFLPLCFDVHHQDEDSTNDSPDNLLLMSHSVHGKLHHPKDYKFGISSTENHLEYSKRRRNSSPEKKHIHYLNSRRYIEKNKEKVAAYMKIYNKQYHKKRKGKENETLQAI
jgi:hypothetical protein